MAQDAVFYQHKNKGKDTSRNFAKSSKTWQNHGKLKKQNNLFSLWG
jgi:hypothetical protein